MIVKQLKEHKFFKYLVNKYSIIFILFLIWMFFFDNNVQLNRELKKEIEKLNTTINFYRREINRDKKTILELKDSLQFERFAREKHFMKKENEDIYVIEFHPAKKE